MNAEPTVGNRIRTVRTAGGLTQSQLSQRCGISKPTLSRYENDHVLPSLTTLRKIANALDVAETTLIPLADRPIDHLYVALKREGVEIPSAAEAERIASLIAQVMTADRSDLA